MWARAGAAPLKDALAYGDVCSEQHHLSTRKGALSALSHIVTSISRHTHPDNPVPAQP